MKVPVDEKEFEVFINESKIFEKTYKLMIGCLENWYNENKEEFTQGMGENLGNVIDTYKFEDEGVSISKSYSYDPPLDYISCWIRIYDSEGAYRMEYTAFFDYSLECFDDRIH